LFVKALIAKAKLSFINRKYNNIRAGVLKELKIGRFQQFFVTKNTNNMRVCKNYFL